MTAFERIYENAAWDTAPAQGGGGQLPGWWTVTTGPDKVEFAGQVRINPADGSNAFWASGDSYLVNNFNDFYGLYVNRNAGQVQIQSGAGASVVITNPADGVSDMLQLFSGLAPAGNVVTVGPHGNLTVQPSDGSVGAILRGVDETQTADVLRIEMGTDTTGNFPNAIGIYNASNARVAYLDGYGNLDVTVAAEAGLLSGGSVVFRQPNGDAVVAVNEDGLGFFNTVPVARPLVAAATPEAIIAALAAVGLIVDGT